MERAKVSGSLKEKHIGAKNELVAAIWLLNNGYEVFRNMSQHGAIDLIAVNENEILLLDVKTAPQYGETTYVNTKRLTEEQKVLGVKFLFVYKTGSCEIVGEDYVRYKAAT